MKPSIYLAGPISGLTYGEARKWRVEVTMYLQPEIDVYCPMRGQSNLAGIGPLEGSYEDDPMTTARAIMIRDHWDCMRADLILVNFIGAKRVSIGTVMEVAWAFAYRKPLIVVRDESNAHYHPMIDEAASYLTTNIHDAAVIARSVLLP